MAKLGNVLLDATTGKVAQAECLIQCNTAAATFKSPTGSSGTFHAFGFFIAPAAAKIATQASPSQTLGTANVAYGAHAFIVASGPGAASGGAGAVTLKITGTSITMAGVRTAGDTEIIVADITAAVANKFIMSQKYWIGQVTFTLDPGGTGHTAYNLSFNYGFIKHFECWEKKSTIKNFEITGRAGANDTGFNVEVIYIKPNATDWTYSAAAFVPGPTPFLKWSTDMSTEKNLANGERFAWSRYNLSQAVDGTIEEGVVVRITTSVNNAVESSDLRLRYSVDA